MLRRFFFPSGARMSSPIVVGYDDVLIIFVGLSPTVAAPSAPSLGFTSVIPVVINIDKNPA